MVCIDWGRLARSVQWYSKYLNASYIDVPWWASKEIMDVTCPPESAGHTYTLDLNGKQLVASAEQSFLYMHAKGLLSKGQLYQTVTPCFREERQNLFSRKHFMKCELFMAADRPDLLERELDDIGLDAASFFSNELDVEVDRVDEQHHGSHPGSFDLVAKDPTGRVHELGSYGIRTHGSLGTWLYATGCAEPRASMVMMCVKGEDPSGSKLEEARKKWDERLKPLVDDLDACGPCVLPVIPPLEKPTDEPRELSFQEMFEEAEKDAQRRERVGIRGQARVDDPGYHILDIPKGKQGELSKVAEELAEAQDAEIQGSKLMLLHELSDVVLAAGGVAERYGFDLDDLVTMAKITRRAFLSGKRG